LKQLVRVRGINILCYFHMLDLYVTLAHNLKLYSWMLTDVTLHLHKNHATRLKRRHCIISFDCGILHLILVSSSVFS
jgi:hypothetical protein